MKHLLKNVKKTVLCLVLALPLALSSVACSGKVNKHESADESKTYFFVQTYAGGFGRDWLDDVVKKFEEMYKDWVNPVNGKTGVQVLVFQNDSTGNNIKTGYDALPNDIYMTESVQQYYDLVAQDRLLDLTDVVTEPLTKWGQRDEETGEAKSIIDLLNKDVANYLGVDEEGETHYYALPYESSFGGMYYDSEMFFNLGLYLTKAYDDRVGNGEGLDIQLGDVITPVAQTDVANYDEYVRITNEGGQDYTETKKGEKLSMGPDGFYGTYDDGLPATYTEFFKLAEYMHKMDIRGKKITPFGFTGKYANTYLPYFVTQLMSDFDGYEQSVMDYTQDGTKTNVIDTEKKGDFVYATLKDRAVGDFSLITGKSVKLNPEGTKAEARPVATSLGKYYALKFLEKMLDYAYNKTTGDMTYISKAVPLTKTHLDAQDAFIKSKAWVDGDETSSDIEEVIAFHIDGMWWENESRINGKFASLTNLYGDNYKQENRHFKLLANPKANMNIVKNGTHKATFMDFNQPLAMALSKMAEEKQWIAKQFMQFAFTRENNKAYTLTTGVPRPYDYDLTDTELDGFTTYQRSIWDAAKVNGSVVFPWTKTPFGILNAAKLSSVDTFNTYVNGLPYSRQIFNCFAGNGFTAEQVFNGLVAYREDKLQDITN